MGAKIVGIIDRDGGLINENGFSFEEIRTLFVNKDGNKLDCEFNSTNSYKRIICNLKESNKFHLNFRRIVTVICEFVAFFCDFKI